MVDFASIDAQYLVIGRGGGGGAAEMKTSLKEAFLKG